MDFADEDTRPILLPAEIVAVADMPSIAFVKSPHCQHISRQKTQCIVIHATDGHEGPTKAEDVAKMLAKPDLMPKRSAHYACDSDSIVQCVVDGEIAWHCGHRGNAVGIGVELCGSTRQTREQWLDAESLPMLRLAARLFAHLCSKYDVPRVFVDAAGLRAGNRGITTHLEVSKAWKETSHTDPGSAFPLLAFIGAVQRA